MSKIASVACCAFLESGYHVIHLLYIANILSVSSIENQNNVLYSTIALVEPISTIVSVSAAVMREQQLDITLSIIGHNSCDSGISVLDTVWRGIVRYHSLIPLWAVV